MDVIHYLLHKCRCPECGKTVKAQLPSECRPGYGQHLSALIAEMSGTQGNSRETVQGFCKSVLGFSISTGAIQNVIDRSSEAIGPYYEAIGDVAKNSTGIPLFGLCALQANLFETHPIMINNWKRNLLEGAADIFDKGRRCRCNYLLGEFLYVGYKNDNLDLNCKALTLMDKVFDT